MKSYLTNKLRAKKKKNIGANWKKSIYTISILKDEKYYNKINNYKLVEQKVSKHLRKVDFSLFSLLFFELGVEEGMHIFTGLVEIIFWRTVKPEESMENKHTQTYLERNAKGALGGGGGFCERNDKN